MFKSSKHNLRRQPAKKWLGQHFLIDESVLASIVEAAQLKPDDRVLEIGPGHGVLTSALAEVVPDGLVLALEKDRDLIEALRERFKNRRNVKIVAGDILTSPISTFLPIGPRPVPSSGPGYKVVANIPYSLTSPILTKFLLGDYRGKAGGEVARPASMTFLVQREVAERLVAPPGDRQRGILTVLVELFGTAELVRVVLPEAFQPPPRVESAVLHLELGPPRAEPLAVLHLLKAGFANKRRQLHNSLAGSYRIPSDQAKTILERAGIGPLLRAEQLTLDQWLELLRTVSETFNL